MAWELATSQLWTNGPVWLKDSELGGPPDAQMPEECLAEMKCCKLEMTHGVLTSTDPPSIEQLLKCENFSLLHRLLSVTAHVLKFCHILVSRFHSDTGQELCSTEVTIWIVS